MVSILEIMERTRNIRIPDLILCSDFHLREDTPTCWIGDFQEEQWNSVDFVSDLQKKYYCAVFHAGDLFHHWKPSPWLLSMAIKHLPQNFHTIYGQHDLPQHNLELVDKCGINVLKEAKSLYVLPYTHYGQEPNMGLEIPFIKQNILVWHHLTYITPPFPGATEGNAFAILRKYPQFDLIVTGDNHQEFYAEIDNRSIDEHTRRLLVNPGSLTRQTADQADFKPGVILWYAEDNTIQWVPIPIQKDVISREHIAHKEERDARIDAFISKLDTDYVAEMSFEENLELFFKKNQINDKVKQIIYKSLENE
jgi:predicted phosphodiesterase